MKTKKEFEEKGFSYPKLKSNGQWGLKNSSILDRDTEEESVKATIEYLNDRGLIK